MAVRYKPEVHEFIQTHLEQFTIREMAENVNRLFGTEFNYDKMKGYYNNHHLRTGKVAGREAGGGCRAPEADR